MDFAGFNWTLITIVGAIVLAAAIAYAALRNKVERKPDNAEQATREVYEKEDRAHRGESDDVP